MEASSLCSSVDGNLYFFKVMVGGFRTQLGIPPAFMKHIRKEDTNRQVFVQDPAGQQWHVYLAYAQSRISFEQGWEKFITDHSLEYGDFLVFKYLSTSKFLVQIFGKSGCPKIIPYISSNMASAPHDRGEENDVKHDTSLQLSSQISLQNQQAVDLKEIKLHASQDPNRSLNNTSANEIGKKISMRGSIAGRKRKLETKKECKTSTKLVKENKACTVPLLISCRRPITEMEKSNALSAANSFTSMNSYCSITMMPSHVYNGFWLAFPKKTGIFKLPEKRIKVSLLDAENKEWICNYIGDNNNNGLSGGWKSFSIDHNLEEDDVCVFELVDTKFFVFRVHIFRVVATCSPYKRRATTEHESRKQKGILIKRLKIDDSSS